MKAFRRAIQYFPRYRRLIVAGFIAIPIGQVLSMAIPWIIGRGIDQLREGSLNRPLSQWFLIIAALATVRGVAKYVMRWCIVGASRHMETDLRNDLFRHLLSLRPDYLQGTRSGDLMTRLTWDVEAVRMFLGPGIMYLAETVLVLPPALLILAWFDWVLAALLLVPLALIVVVMKYSSGPIHVESQKAQERLSDLSNIAAESFAGVRVVRAFAREDAANHRFAASSLEYQDQMVRVAKVRAAAWASMLAAKDIGMLLLISAGCLQLARGEITLGQFMVFSMYLGLLFWPMVALGWMIAMYARAKVSMQRINEIFEQTPALAARGENQAGRNGAPMHVDAAPRIRGEIRFEDMHIERDGREVLRGITLFIPAGAVVGITGTVGSGKSTLAQVLPRLVDIPRGSCFVDGHDILDLDPHALRRAIGVVPQDAFLFADTLRNNVAFGRDTAEDEDLWPWLRAARVDDEVQRLPDGLDSMIGERGVTLSGGQRQRCTIARALAAEPRVLVFDDCLSAVDTETEAEILIALREALDGRTALIISHRVAALRLAEQIVVLDDGRIIQQGPPDELLKQDGPLRRLFERQRAEEELGLLG